MFYSPVHGHHDKQKNIIVSNAVCYNYSKQVGIFNPKIGIK